MPSIKIKSQILAPLQSVPRSMTSLMVPVPVPVPDLHMMSWFA
jgi:hypothetical protein